VPVTGICGACASSGSVRDTTKKAFRRRRIESTAFLFACLKWGDHIIRSATCAGSGCEAGGIGHHNRCASSVWSYCWHCPLPQRTTRTWLSTKRTHSRAGGAKIIKASNPAFLIRSSRPSEPSRFHAMKSSASDSLLPTPENLEGRLNHLPLQMIRCIRPKNSLLPIDRQSGKDIHHP
jgi:hypothetical protein